MKTLIQIVANPSGLDSMTLEEMQLEYVEYVYNKNNKVQINAAKELDIDRKTMYRYLKKLDNNKFLDNEEMKWITKSLALQT